MKKKVNDAKNSKLGFTLLELLVVVIIIGILAAIALPQYRKAVGKAELAQLIVATKALQNAQERFYLTNGDYASNISGLDIDLANNNNITCSVATGRYSSCYNKNYFIAHYYSQDNLNNQIECYAKNEQMVSACESFLNKNSHSSTSGPCNVLGINPCQVVIKKMPM